MYRVSYIASCIGKLWRTRGLINDPRTKGARKQSLCAPWGARERCVQSCYGVEQGFTA